MFVPNKVTLYGYALICFRVLMVSDVIVYPAACLLLVLGFLCFPPSSFPCVLYLPCYILSVLPTPSRSHRHHHRVLLLCTGVSAYGGPTLPHSKEITEKPTTISCQILVNDTSVAAFMAAGFPTLVPLERGWRGGSNFKLHLSAAT